MAEQQPQEVTSEQSEEVRIQKLIDRIDKKGETWEAIQDCKDLLYRKFLAGATTDHEYTIDRKELEDFLEMEVLKITAKFDLSDRLTGSEVMEIIFSGTWNEWNKRSTKVADNIAIGSRALSQVQQSTDFWKQFDNLSFLK